MMNKLKNYIGLWAAAYRYPALKLLDGTVIPAGCQQWALFLRDGNARQLTRAYNYMSDFEIRLQIYFLQCQRAGVNVSLPTIKERAQDTLKALQFSRRACTALWLTEALVGLEGNITQPALEAIA